MKMRLPVFVLALVVIVAIAILSTCHADVVGTGPAPDPVILPKTTSPVYFHLGALNLTVPWDQVNAAYLFDLESKTNFVGGEAGIATLWKLQGTIGAVTDLAGKGNPFLGGNLFLPNPVPSIAILNEIKPGVFAGWNWVTGKAMFGFKASMPIF